MLKGYAILLALALALMPLVGVQADSMDGEVFCGDLLEADCQILLDNADVMDSLNSLAFFVNMSLDADTDEGMQLFAQGHGGFELDNETLRAVNEMSEDVSEADLGALVELLLTSVKAELWFEVKGTSGTEDVDIELQLRLKDGVVLVGADALEALTGEPMTGVEAFGIDLNGAIGEMLEESGAMPAADVSDMEEAEAAAMTITRLPDSEVTDVAVAVFETDIDLDTFFSLVSAEELVAASNDLEDQQSARELIEAIGVKEFYTRQYIGLEDYYTYRMDMVLDVSIAGENYDMETDASFVMDMSILLSDFNEPVHVEIPEDAFVFPLAMIMQMGSQ